jgi:hypothetical protein
MKLSPGTRLGPYKIRVHKVTRPAYPASASSPSRSSIFTTTFHGSCWLVCHNKAHSGLSY